MKIEVIYINNRPEPGLHIIAETKEEKLLLGMLHYIRFESKKNLHLGIYRSYNSEQGIDAIDIHYREFQEPDPYLLPTPIDVFVDESMAEPQMQQLIYGTASEVDDDKPSIKPETPPQEYDKSNLDKWEQDTGKKLSEKQKKDIIDQDLTTKSPSERFVFFHKTQKVADAPFTVAEKQDAIKDKVTILCPVCKTPFEKKHAQKYCSKKCGQQVHNANYLAKHMANYKSIKASKTQGDRVKTIIDPQVPFQPDPEPSGEFDGPF